MHRTRLIVIAALLAAPVAAAAPPTARDRAAPHVDAGEALLRARQPDKALAEFQAAYDADPDPLYRFYMAVAYRQRGDLDRALEAARTARAAAVEAADKDAIDKFIARTEEERGQQQAAAPRLPSPFDPGQLPRLAAGDPPRLSPPAPSVVAASPAPTPAPGWRVTAQAGPGLPFVLGPRLDRPVSVPALAVGTARVLATGDWEVDAGPLLTFAPLPYRRQSPDHALETATLFALLAQASARHSITGAAAFTASVGLGVALWGGAGEDNPFAADGRPFHQFLPTVRAATGLEWSLSPATFVALTPSVTFGKTAGGAPSEVGGILALDLVAAVGARL
jgi:hypothetical protein